MLPIQDSAADPKCKRLVVVMGAQMGKTEGLLNIIGHRMDDDPTPMLYVGPTQKNVESISKDRFTAMLKSTPSLGAKLEGGKRNSIGEKYFNGVRLGFAWAGSATELASHPAGLVLLDERDRMDNNAGGEGDPVELTDARTSTFPDGRQIITSTPTMGTVDVYTHPNTGLEHWKVEEVEEVGDNPIESPIWRLWQSGSRKEWAWPCPECDEYFIPRFRHLKWPKGATPAIARKDARLCCPHCGSLIEEKSKREMNEKGRFAGPGQSIDRDGNVTGPELDEATHTFWVSGLCSPWRSFGARAASMVTAYRSGDQDVIQAALNTGFGELYSVAGQAPPVSAVMALRSDYISGQVPRLAQILTVGIDVQKTGLYYSVRGWGCEYESWGIEAGMFLGDPAEESVWRQVDNLREREFNGQRIVRAAIDSGYKPGETQRDDHSVYIYCRRNKGWAIATKGHDKQNRPYFSSQIDISYRGKILPKGLQLWHLDTDYFKTWLYGRFELPAGHPGAFHLPRDATDNYCLQLVSESRIVKPSGQVAWMRIRNDNHYLDCESLNVFAAHTLSVHNLTPPPDEEEIVAQAKAEREERGVTSSWLQPKRNWL